MQHSQAGRAGVALLVQTRDGGYGRVVMLRQGSRSGCSQQAVATLTFGYLDRTVVLGPLSRQQVPGCYDLCVRHAERTSAPVGWEVLRLAELSSLAPAPDEDDLLALARAVREIGFSDDDEPAQRSPGRGDPDTVVELAHRGHLRVIADAGRLGG